MGQYHIGIREGRRRGSHWHLRIPKDLHLDGYRALTLFEGCLAVSSSCMPICAIKRHKHSRIGEKDNLHDAQNSRSNMKDCTTKITIYKKMKLRLAAKSFLYIKDRSVDETPAASARGDPASNLERKADRFWPCGMK